MSSAFNPETFLDAPVTAALSTQYIPVPEGEYVATVKAVTKPRQAGENFVMDVRWAVTDPTVLEATGQEESIVSQAIWLDLNSHGALDTGRGKNVGLGRLREAFNLNRADQPFSFRMMEGRSAKIKVKHETDKEGVIRGKVVAVAPL